MQLAQGLPLASVLFRSLKLGMNHRLPSRTERLRHKHLSFSSSHYHSKYMIKYDGLFDEVLVSDPTLLEVRRDCVIESLPNMSTDSRGIVSGSSIVWRFME